MVANIMTGIRRRFRYGAELVEKMAGIVREFSLEPVTPQEAREILGIPKRN
jgi:uncharacterized protein (DUF849 family)